VTFAEGFVDDDDCGFIKTGEGVDIADDEEQLALVFSSANSINSSMNNSDSPVETLMAIP
jgi:hypothetical protein